MKEQTQKQKHRSNGRPIDIKKETNRARHKQKTTERQRINTTKDRQKARIKERQTERHRERKKHFKKGGQTDIQNKRRNKRQNK